MNFFYITVNFFIIYFNSLKKKSCCRIFFFFFLVLTWVALFLLQVLNCDLMKPPHEEQYSQERNHGAYMSMRDYRHFPWQNQQPVERNPSPSRSMWDYRNPPWMSATSYMVPPRGAPYEYGYNPSLGNHINSSPPKYAPPSHPRVADWPRGIDAGTSGSSEELPTGEAGGGRGKEADEEPQEPILQPIPMNLNPSATAQPQNSPLLVYILSIPAANSKPTAPAPKAHASPSLLVKNIKKLVATVIAFATTSKTQAAAHIAWHSGWFGWWFGFGAPEPRHF